MMNVIIKEKYKTSFGKVIQVEQKDGIKVGEAVIGDDGNVYYIKKIIMPTKYGVDTMGLVYE